MIVVGMGDQDMGYRLAVERPIEGVDMLIQKRARVDDGDIAMANDIGPGSFEGEGAAVPAQSESPLQPFLSPESSASGLVFPC